MKKVFYNSLFIVVGAALGLAVGFALRGKPNADATAEVSESISSAQKKTSSVSRSNSRGRPNDDSPLATKLEHDLSLCSGVTRWLYWLEALEKASASDFPRLFRLAESNPAARRLVSQRWIELYPQQLFQTIVDAVKSGGPTTRSLADLSYPLFNDWSKRDPDAAIAALSGEDFAMRNAWRRNAADAIIGKDAERGLSLFSEWHIDNYSPRMNAIAKWAAADPQHAAEFALANPSGAASETAMETIGKEWAKIDPAAALKFAAANPGTLGTTLASNALKEWAGSNLNEAANWLATTDDQTRNHLSPAFVEAWGKLDANAALNWCESNLSGSGLAQSVGSVLKGAAAKDIAAAAALVTSLNPSAARSEAAIAVAEKWFPNSLGTDTTVSPAAVAWLGSLDSESAKRVVDEIQWMWATCNPNSMAEFLASRSEPLSANPYNVVARELARKNPIEAIAWTDRLPEERSTSAGAEAFMEWRHSQPDAATKWFNELPSTDPRRVPFFQGVVRSLAWDSQGAAQLAAFPPSDRAMALNVIKDMTLPDDRRSTLLQLLK